MKWFIASLLFLVSFSAAAEKVDLNNASMRDFIGWYAKRSGRSVVLSPDVTGTITIYSADVTKDNLDDFFVSVLRANGFDITSGNPSVITKYEKKNYDYDDDIDITSDGEADTETGQGGFLNPPANLVTRTYNIKNVRAKDLAPVIEIYLKRENVSGANVFPFDGANIIAVSATEEQQNEIETVLPVIDIPRDQVLIEGLIFETAEGSSFDFSFAAGRSSGGKIVGGVNTSALGETLSTPGAAFGIFSGNVLGLSIQAVQKDSNSSILSVPHILTMSGEKGYISVGQNVPFITGRATGEAASIDSPFQTIERQDVGVSLTVNPVVTTTQNVIMNIQVRADSVSNDTTASDIITNQRQIETTVSIKDGQTLLLGGLIDNSSRKENQDTPFLSSIPVIGWLFSSTSDESKKQTLYVMIRARVLKAL
ncbi:TPA: general secretion pathway protein GspD [Citrobacter werkmanii]|nr:general secretion pathway protein GspD [Citrobacter werkmanii]